MGTSGKAFAVNMDSFEAVGKYGEESTTLVMNFANVHHLGGGFRNGASAQEESLCRCSTLYASIGSDKAREMYDYNNAHRNALDSDYLLPSPDVSGFRRAGGELLDQPFRTAVVTIAAPNLNGMACDINPEALRDDMIRKIENMCAVAAELNYRTLILGPGAAVPSDTMLPGWLSIFVKCCLNGDTFHALKT